MTSKCNTVVFVTNNIGRGGAERVMSILANHYARKGWRVSILVLLHIGEGYSLDPAISVIDLTHEACSRIRQLPGWIKSIRRCVRKMHANTVISLLGRTNVVTLFSCLGLNTKAIVAEGSNPMKDGRTPFSLLCCKALYPLADKVLFQTRFQQEYFHRYTKNNGIITSMTNPIELAAPGSTRFRSNEIVTIGNLSEAKNHMLLINAFARLSGRYPQAYLIIYGEGRLRGALEQQIARLGLEGRVLLPGNVPDARTITEGAACFAFSSSYEGLPNALLEAMSAGIPCVSTNWSGVEDIICNNENGLIVPSNDAEALAEAICQILSNKKEADKMAGSARETVKRFEEGSVLQQWDELIER